MQDLDQHELAVFRHFIPAGKNPHTASDAVDSMMVAHAQYPHLEPDGLPASLSHRIVTGLLREELDFAGLIMTDDLDMGAILNHYSLEETIRLAIGAGNDLAMICHRIEVLREARTFLDGLPTAELDRALHSVSSFKEHLAPPDTFSRGGIPPPRRRSVPASPRNPRAGACSAAQPGRRQTLTCRNILNPTQCYPRSNDSSSFRTATKKSAFYALN